MYTTSVPKSGAGTPDGQKVKKIKEIKIFRRGETTPNFKKAQDRKRRNKKIREQEEIKEAQLLGISVFQLKVNKLREVEEIRRKVTVIVTTPPRRDRYGYGW